MDTGGSSYLEIRLEFSEPMEIGDLAALFEGFGANFQRFLESEHPELKGDAKLYVKRIHEGSIVADVFANIPDLIGLMDDVLIVGGFASLFSKRVRTWISGSFVKGVKKSDLNNATNTLKALAKDRGAKLSLSKFQYRSGLWSHDLIAEFDSTEAQRAMTTIDLQLASQDQTDIADHHRVLMVFKRMDKEKVKPGSGTGDRVVIESIDPSNKPVFYASDTAGERIKDELTHSEFPFRLGFVVDVNVATRNGRVAAYSVVNVHDVITLDEE